MKYIVQPTCYTDSRDREVDDGQCAVGPFDTLDEAKAYAQEFCYS